MDGLMAKGRGDLNEGGGAGAGELAAPAVHFQK